MKTQFDAYKQVYRMTIMSLILIFSTTLYGQTTRYVKPVATGSGDGSSWANASSGLQAMINASASGDAVWVAAGTYKPTSGTDRNISFSMKNGVAIYGGFDGTETQLSARDWKANETILSGDIGTADDNSDNSYIVIINNNNGVTSSAVLDGFTITKGNANGGNPYSRGGGMHNIYASPTISNCTFIQNNGFFAKFCGLL